MYLKKFLKMLPGESLVGVVALGVELLLEFDSTLSELAHVTIPLLQ